MSSSFAGLYGEIFGLENFQRLPSVQADIQIMPGTEPGQSELHIRWQQSLPLRANLSLDDAGSPSTGRYQANLSLSYDHWWTLNDMFYLTLGKDAGGGQPGERGTRNASVHYSVPWGYWLLSLNASQSRYFQSVAGATTDYRYSGNSGQQDISLSRVVHRNGSGKTTLGLKAFARQSNNFIDDTEVEVQRRRVGGWALSLAHRQQFGSNQLELEATYKRGTGAFNAQAAPEELFGEGTSRFALLNVEASWTQPFTLGSVPVQWSSRWRGQRDYTPLTPQDRFAIGGRYSVRGFDGESSLSAERGWTWRNELSVPLGQSGQQLYLGLDQGWVGGASVQYLLGQRLAGVVLGLRGGLGPVRYDVFVGQPVRKPLYFVTAKTTAGFQLSVNF